MKADSRAGNGGSIVTRKNLALMGMLAVVLASGWYCFARYKNSSGASVREQILQQREVETKEEPQRVFYGILGGMNLTAGQQAKMNATRDLPLDKEGWTERKKVLGETLTDGQMKQMTRNYVARSNADWERKTRNMSAADKEAMRKQMEGFKKDRDGSGKYRKGEAKKDKK